MYQMKDMVQAIKCANWFINATRRLDDETEKKKQKRERSSQTLKFLHLIVALPVNQLQSNWCVHRSEGVTPTKCGFKILVDILMCPFRKPTA